MAIGSRGVKRNCHFSLLFWLLLWDFQLHFHELLCSLKIKTLSLYFTILSLSPSSSKTLGQDVNRKKTARVIDFRISHLGSSVWLSWFPSCTLSVTNFSYTFMVRCSVLFFAWLFKVFLHHECSALLVSPHQQGQKGLIIPNKHFRINSQSVAEC